jgi:hypothetical protein
MGLVHDFSTGLAIIARLLWRSLSGHRTGHYYSNHNGTCIKAPANHRVGLLIICLIHRSVAAGVYDVSRHNDTEGCGNYSRATDTGRFCAGLTTRQINCTMLKKWTNSSDG